MHPAELPSFESSRLARVLAKLRDYAYLVPCVESESEIFLKSIMPSRKATRAFLSGDK